jgi:PQQ-like domain
MPAIVTRGAARIAALALLAAVLASPLLSPVPIASAATRRPALWLSRYDGPAHGDDEVLRFNSTTTSPDGTKVFVAGSSQGTGGAGSFDYVTIAYDAVTGLKLWDRRYDGTGGFDDIVSYVAASPDGTTVFVSGSSPGPLGIDDFLTIAYDAATGNIRWLRRYDAPAHGVDDPSALTTSPDGTQLFVTGSSQGSLGDDDYATIAYDTATGATRWLRRYDGPAHGEDTAQSVVITPDSATVIVTGSSDRDPRRYRDDYTTIAYSASTGSSLWLQRYKSPLDGSNFPWSMAVSEEGTKVFVTGAADWQDALYGSDYATVAYDTSTGSELWVARYDNLLSDTPYSIAVSPDDHQVVVTGYSDSFGTSDVDFATVAYDTATGTQQWVSRYDGPTHYYDFAYDLVFSGSEVFVTGSSEDSGTGRGDYATVAYDAASGALDGVKRYDGPAHDSDWSYSVEASPDGSRVYVSGASTGVGTGYDIATIAYGT